MRTRASIGLIVLGAALAGCGSSSSPAPTPTRSPATQGSLLYVPSKSTVPPCAGPLKSMPFPSAFPHDFPVIPGTSIGSQRVPIGGGIAVAGASPSKSFNESVHFYPRVLPSRGYTVLHVEIDAPHDTEGSFRGHGLEGGWSMQSIPGCPAMRLQIEVRPARPVK